jgi:hypothetical protein
MKSEGKDDSLRHKRKKQQKILLCMAAYAAKCNRYEKKRLIGGYEK